MTSTIPMEEIKAQFTRVIQWSQNFTHVNVDKLFDEWYEAKKGFIEQWGDLIYTPSSRPISFELSQEEKKRRLSDFIDIVENHYGNNALAAFLYDNQQDFFTNRLSQEYRTVFGTVIPKDMKVIKAFKFFEDDERALTDLQNQASMIIQEDKVEGVLCFSVHPLDFLSTSETTYHWRSCHALDGEYRCGNLSYMMDKSTVICYLRGATEAVLPNFPPEMLWNSKKWRMLLFFSDAQDAMFAGRQYPFESPSALRLIQPAILHSIKNNKRWSNWYNDYLAEIPRPKGTPYEDTYFDERVVGIRHRPYIMSELITDQSRLHFNDLKYSSCYIPYYCWQKMPYTEKGQIHFTIGGQVPCLCCGTNKIKYTDLMFCEDCACEYGKGEDDRFVYCTCCDRRIVRDSGAYWVEGLDSYVCEECYNQQAQRCENCHDIWLKSDIIYHRETQKNLCPRCASRFERQGTLDPPIFSTDDYLSFWDNFDLPF